MAGVPNDPAQPTAESLPIPPQPSETSPYSPWQRLTSAMPRDAMRRGGGFALAIGIELLIIALLLTLGMGVQDDVREYVPITSFDVGEPPAPQAEEEPEDASEPEAAAQSAPDTPAQPQQQTPQRPAPSLLPTPFTLPQQRTAPQPEPAPSPAPAPQPTGRIGAVVRSDRAVGPADTGNPRGADSERVGTAPDGSPLYAARWFREPSSDQLSGYLSTASGPGWGLIACRTARDWRVEDCEVLGEYPQNSGIGRAVQAAAWQFQVRPPRLGGEYQVGTWVRIRIDYTSAQRLR